MKFFHLEREFYRYKSEYLAAIEKVLNSGIYLEGDLLRKLEEVFARFVGASYVVGVASGVDALALALKVLDIGPGDEVITTNFAPAAHLMAILEAGARPVFVDVDAKTGLMRHDLLEEALTPYTRAVIPFHIFGYCENMDEINAFADKHGLFVIENAWQAISTYYKDKHVGTLGTIGVFSFYPTTTIGGFGDAGILVTQDSKIYEKLLKIRHADHFDVNLARKTMVSRMSEIQAAFLLVKMKYAKDQEYRRFKMAKKIMSELPFVDFIKPAKYCKPNYHLLTFITESRDEMKHFLEKNKLPVHIYYPYVLNKLDKTNPLYYKTFPGSDRISKMVLSLPACSELSAVEVNKLISIIKDFYEVLD